MSKWRAVRFSSGAYGVFKTERGEIVYSGSARRHEFDTVELANDWAAKLNGETPAPRRCSAQEFDAMTGHVALREKTRVALRSILVDGWTWRRAAEQHGITESGILRAMRRVSKANHA